MTQKTKKNNKTINRQCHKNTLAEIDFLRDLVQQAPGFIVVLINRDYEYYMVNNAFMDLVGNHDLIGRTVAEAMPEIPRQGFIALLDQVWETQEALKGICVPILIDRPDSDEADLHYIDFVHSPIKDSNGEMLGIYVQGIDVTERKNFENQLHILANESAHRVKNILSIVQAIITRTLKSSKDVDSAISKVTARLSTIAKAQTSFAHNHNNQYDLKTLIQSSVSLALDTFDNIKMQGKAVYISEKARLPLALIFHELMTNAIKYGALSKNTGSVSITWKQDKNGAIDIEWLEKNGPKVKPPAKKGFGSSLIERSLGYNPENTVTIDFLENGLLCKMKLANVN